MGIRRANHGARHRRMAWADIYLGLVVIIESVVFFFIPG
jgi:hypothetical protein